MYCISGLSTKGSISLGIALVIGNMRVPKPATGITAFTDSPLIKFIFYNLTDK
jgi:hypothetical protein